MMNEAIVLSLKNLTKQYPGVLALDRVSLDFVAGEVHALLMARMGVPPVVAIVFALALGT